MTKVLLVFISCVSLAAIWLDPFTHTLHPAGPDAAPTWWRIIAVLDTILLTAFAWSAVRSRWRHAYALTALSTILSLLANAVYVRVRGIDRFLIILRTEEILSAYLFLISLRVATLFVCGVAADNQSRRNPSHK